MSSINLYQDFSSINKSKTYLHVYSGKFMRPQKLNTFVLFWFSEYLISSLLWLAN